ncbi:MAG: hypothetical protein E3J72_10400 [Planctomycetota bacterium]|nr:MAG: hypothetical protein E3J72_10400 [Planctomycetota bacterium]
MKSNLPLISGIIIVVVFGLVIAGCLLWRPMKMRWLEGRLESGKPRERLEAIEKLFAMGEDGEAVVDKHMVGQTVEWVEKKFGICKTVEGKPTYKTWNYPGIGRFDGGEFVRITGDGNVWIEVNEEGDPEKVYICLEKLAKVTLCYGKVRIDSVDGKAKMIRLSDIPPKRPRRLKKW